MVATKIKQSDLKTFEYDGKRAVYSECMGINCPNLEVKFIKEFLKRNHSVIFVTLNQPHIKIEKKFGKTNLEKVYFIDCVSNMCGGDGENTVCIEPGASLTQIKLAIDVLWKKIKGKKILFFDYTELLFQKYDKKAVINFIHEMVQQLQMDGIPVFCFIKNGLDQQTEKLVKNLFDEIVSM